MRAKEESRRHPTRMQMNTETPLAPRIELDEEMIELAEAQRNMELEQIDHEFQGDESGRHLARLNVNMRMERSGFPVDPNQGEKDLAGVHRNTETSPMEFSRGQRDAGIRPMQHGVEEDERLLEIRERWLALQRMKFELEEAKFELEKRRLEIEIEKLEIEKERLDVEIKIEEVEKQLDALRRQQV
ncbi:hypothetical protein BGZ61DRAFT_441635 [Ilyonectria robusta]|uniref:uncharacterized protein n=1 Tax=Ilyonectria robusta TaxID=1079257 RepID=UPI001E8EA68D|nr:uncharacterized protein BGZ61DRAFT_441635 [Ilyonectria robusta]KAH8736163.1 hypothetical protein BGZ61DRAFT_441635 [Ilyonectria robusta]